MSNSFEAQVDKIVVNTEKRLTLVMQQSLLNAVNEMQTPTAKGGRMRVDTGFLRASGQSSLNGMPTGPSRNMNGQTNIIWNENQTELVIAKLTFGSTFFFGWTANYAKYRNAFDGFLDVTVQRWQQIVDNVVNEAKQRFSK